jgi:hypothetical protein
VTNATGRTPAELLKERDQWEAEATRLHGEIKAFRKAWIGDDFGHLPLAAAMEAACKSEMDHDTAQNMPGGMTEQIDLIRAFAAENPGTVAILERVGTYMPGNSGPAAATFARHCGHLEAALYAFGVPTEQVAPGVWQRGLGGFSSDKKKRKNEIKELMARTYPHINVTLKTADALGILTWTLKQQTKTGE